MDYIHKLVMSIAYSIYSFYSDSECINMPRNELEMPMLILIVFLNNKMLASFISVFKKWTIEEKGRRKPKEKGTINILPDKNI